MADADVPCEGDGFRGAFDDDGADAGAALDVFDTDEFGFRSPIRAVEADAHVLVGGGEFRFVHFVVERGGQHVVGFRVGVDEVFHLALCLFAAGEDGAADFEGVAVAEAGRGLLLDADDAHAVADFRVAERGVDELFGQVEVVVVADEPRRAARELQSAANGAAAVEPTQRVEARLIVERVVGADPLVEGTGERVLVVEGHGPEIGREFEI